MNIVIYARFSSHSQNEQSIEGQLKVCYDYAERNGYKVIGKYIDREISGTSDARPEFQRMIADSAKRQFGAVLVYQLDRFARNRYDSATYKAKLKKNGVKVLSARENITDDASGVLMEAVLEGMAEYYSVELAQKIRRGMDLNAEKCLATGGNVALGYKVDENKRFVIDEGEAYIVKKRFSRCTSPAQLWLKSFTTSTRIKLKPAVEAGKSADVISAQIEKRQTEKAELETQLAKEKIQRPQLEYSGVKFFFERFAKGDPNDIDYRRSLVDVFIGRVELSDSRLRIRLNVQEGQKTNVPIDEPKGSSMGRMVEATGLEPAASTSRT